MRRLRHAILLLFALGAGLVGLAYWGAVADPVVKRVAVAMPGWPAGAGPVRVLLMSDIHLGNAATGPKRLARIVAQANALGPDLILIAGDVITGHDPHANRAAIAALPRLLGALKAPMGVVAVPGNHDHRNGPAVLRAIRAAGITLLENGATRRGPIAIGGLDDDFSGHAQIAPTMAALDRLQGAKLILTHSPDVVPHLPGRVRLVLAGHTHCGQVVLPLIGYVTTASRHGARYACGVVREGGRTVIIAAGTGTSMLPIRIGAPPDLWLVTLGPATRRR